MTPDLLLSAAFLQFSGIEYLITILNISKLSFLEVSRILFPGTPNTAYTYVHDSTHLPALQPSLWVQISGSSICYLCVVNISEFLTCRIGTVPPTAQMLGGFQYDGARALESSLYFAYQIRLAFFLPHAQKNQVFSIHTYIVLSSCLKFLKIFNF